MKTLMTAKKIEMHGLTRCESKSGTGTEENREGTLNILHILSHTEDAKKSALVSKPLASKLKIMRE